MLIRIAAADSRLSLSSAVAPNRPNCEALGSIEGTTMLRIMMAMGAAIALGGGVCCAQDAAGFVDQVQVISPRISPGGREVALIRRTASEQQVVVVNLAAGHARAVQTVK